MIDIQLTPAVIERGCVTHTEDFIGKTPWDVFMSGLSVHIGKRSSGWKFCWNFNDYKYYTNKSELFEFIRSGRIVDEYGEIIPSEEFIRMALNWDKTNKWTYNDEYLNAHPKERPTWMSDIQNHYDLDIEGLRVSRSTNFS